MPLIVHLDLETRSACSLKACGAHRYACDESTRILMAGVSADGDDRVWLWVHPDFETGDMLSDPEALDLLRRADLVYCHNSPFESALLWGRGLKDLGLEIDLSKYRCTAAMARKAALPWALDKLAACLGLEQQKDTRGKRLIKLFCEPQKDGLFIDPRSRPLEWTEMGEYCRQDVRTEKAVHKKLTAFELTGAVLESFQFDARMNFRGIPVCVPALQNAQKIIDRVEQTVTKEFVALTGITPTRREEVRKLVGLPNMQAETVKDALEDRMAPLDAKQRRILELYAKLSFAAVKKVQTMLDWVCPDGRIRGSLLWHGAGPGRWTARGPQFQNAKKATVEMRPMTQSAYLSIGRGASAEEIDLIYGEPYDVLASSIRHFVHLPGSEMLDGDFNAAEGRIACWVAKEEIILQAWRDGVDLYKRAAAFVFNVSESSIGKGEKRDFGKVVELACQFGLGDDGFMRTCESWGIPCDLKLAHRAVHEYYRPTHPNIVNQWWWMDRCMKEAVAYPGVQQGLFIVRQLAGRKYLLMKLPSGRSIAYADPEVKRRVPTREELEEMKKGKKFPDSRFMELTYWGQLFGSALWGRVRLWGSKSFENLVQGIAADFMAHGAMTAESRGMEPFLLIHDQSLAIRRDGKTAEDYAAALSFLPPWAKGMPLKTEAKICMVYSK